MRKFLICSLVVLATAAMGHASSVTMTPSTLDALLGGTYAPASIQETTHMSTADLTANIVSEAFTNGSGLYAYLYQVTNTGGVNDGAVEQFTLWPLVGATTGFHGSVQAGYLNEDPALPPGFQGGGVTPQSPGNFSNTSKVFSFYFQSDPGPDIGISQHSAVLYVLSNLAPGNIVGSVIDGTPGTGGVVGPTLVPEPVTIFSAFLAIGSLGMYVRKRMHRTAA